MSSSAIRMQVVDSHTGGEPTRVIVAGGPELGDGSLNERLVRFRENCDEFRRLAINEPRGSDVMVGALLCEPDDPSCAAGVIFFNNTGYLGMCGHGAIGVAVTLHHLDQVGTGICRLQTPVGIVEANLLNSSDVAIENVPSYRFRKQVTVKVEGLGNVVGDIAWGGNWFFLVEKSPVTVSPDQIGQLTAATLRVKSSLHQQGITGVDGAEIDHIEFFGESNSPGVDSRNFVLCPGGAYDRSPCGTGTSAKLACLAADGKLLPGQSWTQESIIGSRFTGTYQAGSDSQIIPTITGSAFISGEGSLIGHPEDPFRCGIPTGDEA